MKSQNYIKESPREVFSLSNADKTVAGISQGLRFGKIGLRFTAESKGKKKGITLCNYLKEEEINTLLMELRQPKQNDVLLYSVHTISAGVCAEKGYRSDGKAIYKTFTVTAASNNSATLTTTLQAADESPGGTVTLDMSVPCKTITITLFLTDLQQLLIALLSELSWYQFKRTREENEKGKRRVSRTKQIDVARD